MSKQTLRSDPTYYRIEYSRIVQLLNQLTAAPNNAPVREIAALADDKLVAEAVKAALPETPLERKHVVEPASSQAHELIAKSRDELMRLRWRWVGRRPPWYARWRRKLKRRSSIDQLAAFLDEVLEPASVVLYFSCVVEEKRLPGIEGLDRCRSSQQALDRRASRRPKDAIDEEWLREYLRELVAPAPEPSSALKKAAAVIGAVRWRQPSDTNYRVRYNLACLFSRIGERAASKDERARYLDKAGEQLDLCLSGLVGARRQALFEWAQRDPGLVELMSKRGKAFRGKQA